jgi:hypothetical protein
MSPQLRMSNLLKKWKNYVSAYKQRSKRICEGLKQVDLVDMQSLPDGDYKFIMHYLDHLTKFSVLKALTSKRAAEVGYQLLDIFLLFGAQGIL